MHESEADFTNTFLDLMKEQTPPKGAAYNDEKFKQWHARWESQLKKEDPPHSIVKRLPPRLRKPTTPN